MFTVYTEIHENGKISRYFYGEYNRNKANEVAMELGNDYENHTYHRVCASEECESLGIYRSLFGW